MKHISEESTEQDVFNLSLNSIKKMLAINVLTAKTDGYRLKEYVQCVQ